MLTVCTRLRSKKSGYFIVTKAEKMVQKEEVAYKLQLKAKGLANKDGILGKSDPFVMVNAVDAGGGYHVIAKTEYINNNLNPTWQPITVNVADCRGLSGRLKIQVYGRVPFCHSFSLLKSVTDVSLNIY